MRKIFYTMLLLTVVSNMTVSGQNNSDMDKMWGDQSVKNSSHESEQVKMFRDGNFAMFVHWGLYSSIGNIWKGKTYYGISEWIMSKSMADIPVDEYKMVATKFNPSKFDAKKLVETAKNAGMKYIIVTSKHHDGFAMFNTKYDDFNIVTGSPFGRDPMKEISDECKKNGLGFGFYYSQTQDWTSPGGFRGPTTDSNNKPVTFKDYFYGKCLPQIKELCTNYGDLTLVWFDTPGNIEEKYVREIIKTVRKYQPNALISGRVGHDLGDYVTLGDMEIPHKNESGLWETVDVTNDSWGFSYSDKNWKTPDELIERLLSTVARGGTYMLNVGPKPDGTIPVQAEFSLKKVGQWINKYPYTVYNAAPSPWGKPLPWGDVVLNNDKMYLLIFDWPSASRIVLHGLVSKIKKATLIRPNGNNIELNLRDVNGCTSILLPAAPIDMYVSVIEVETEGDPKVETGAYLDPEYTTTLNVDDALVHGASLSAKRWMEKFGEWKKIQQVNKWTPDSYVQWDVDIVVPGYYEAALSYAGKGRVAWKIMVDEKQSIINQQNSSHIYAQYPWGWIAFDKPGKYTIKVSFETGDIESVSLTNMSLKRVR